jgi:hypothetical protein
MKKWSKKRRLVSTGIYCHFTNPIAYGSTGCLDRVDQPVFLADQMVKGDNQGLRLVAMVI